MLPRKKKLGFSSNKWTIRRKKSKKSRI